MRSERWRRVEELYHAALARDERDCATFLADACAGDSELRSEVESLLAQGASADAFLAEPAVDVAAQLVSDPGGSVLTGRRIGAYQLQNLLGAGGMGEVYRARDTKLGRDVAIKILPRAFTSVPDRLARFEREARMLASLNHPHVGAIYSVEESDGVRALVLELVEGLTLAERLAKGSIPLTESLAIARQIAEALEAAHEKGIIHRDLKPANVKITSAGVVKVLDFGLAKLDTRDGSAPDLTESPTVTVGGTRDGIVLGTAAYMSPEQARGLAVDRRTDIWAFGCVLYEMLTGSSAFPGETAADVLAGILQRDPDWTRLPANMPPAVEHGLRRCFEKDLKRRWRDIRDVRVEIIDGQTSPDRGGHAAPPHRRKQVAWMALGLTIAAAAGIVAVFYVHRIPPLTDRDTIVLADFTNTTGDPLFDGTLKQGLSVQMEQSPFLSLVSDQQIQQTLQLMGQKPEATLTPQMARELCQRTASAAVLEGSIAQIGIQYLLTLKAVECVRGESLASTEAQANDKSHVLEALGRTSSDIRNKLGESLRTAQKFDTPVEQATTPSLEALQAYSFGLKGFINGEYAAVAPLLQRAIRLDPNFAMAYALLGDTYVSLGETSLAAENYRKAYELRERVSEREKLYIESDYYQNVTGDLEEARQVAELWAQTYPRDFVAPANLGFIDRNLGQYDRALAEFRESFRLGAANRFGYATLVASYLSLNRLQEARATADEAQAKYLDSPPLRFYLYLLAFLTNDAAGMAQQVAWSAGKPRVEDVLLVLEADTAVYSGRLMRASEFSRQAVASAERAKEKETAAEYEADLAVQLALLGKPAEARQRTREALGRSNGRDVQFRAALALGFAGDAIRCQSLADDLAKRFLDDTLVQINYLPTLHAQVALTRHDPSKAIETLQAAMPYELGWTTAGVLYPVFVRGEAYLAAHQGREAAAEFQKILDHHGLVGNEPIGALAHWGLARAYTLQGQTANSRAAYQDFLTLWKDADPDIPILGMARAEYAKLK
jgi:serine/threonine protein kinase/tetratricopeptide (TPR) repeat protein